ncbi:MAG: bis-aminopropyl spermidine synthase family protein, partial [Proteobacteria bacterium]|nr:bis-aminopropyl spermidine synthase family protein [Pseudomonadota bacterium]
IHVLDFDERIVNANRRFAESYDLKDILTADLYNVCDPLPEAVQKQHDAFYTNPPFGSSNGGRSVEIFVRRGIESCKPDATGCIVIADGPELPWITEVMRSTQQFVLDKGFVIIAALRALRRTRPGAGPPSKATPSSGTGLGLPWKWSGTAAPSPSSTVTTAWTK